MSSAEAAAGPAPVFAALGDVTRLSLLKTLSDGERRSIATLSAGSILTRQAVTKHLHVLEQAGLVTSRRHGRERSYAFQPEPVERARAYLDQVSAQWGDALGRLRALVED
jgi:DNA-binding transcriptional ArsR family regulator